MQKVVYIRNWKCAVCDSALIYDPEELSMTCKCSTRTVEVPRKVLEEAFHETIVEDSP